MLAFSMLVSIMVTAQNEPIIQQDSVREQLKEVIINSSRIDLPFLENSRTITIITSNDIKQSAATTVADVLQQFAGVDIRRRGTAGMQADLYIRGGSFDQTLLLIDGIKVEDAQTGHHSMNMALPVEVIERIEIIKGPAARVFGQNAFTGAINIVTKKNQDDVMSLGIQAGSYGQKNALVTIASNLENSSHLIHVSRNLSDGYRYNTDYDNQNYFIKSTFNKKSLPVNMITSFSERHFGANGFYASPTAINQYEETQTSLVGFSTEIKNQELTLKPRLYWRRNQDEYVFVRQDPSIYRNLHQTNKIGAEMNMEFRSRLGVTGLGVDLAKVYLSSNNLGNRNRFMTTIFFEHLFKLANDKLDITPGVAINYFSDFKFHAFPGLDIGFRFNETLKIYGNIGYTYRIPTYTDLYYSDPTTVGDENLDPEEAIAQELGLKYNTRNFSASIALFNRDANKLIDYVKENIDDRWKATNIVELNTKGFELNTHVDFKLSTFDQSLNISYNFLNDDVKNLNVNFSRYSINSLKHHVTSRLSTQFFNKLSQNIVYKYAQRTNGESYAVVDASLNLNLHPFEIFIMANNVFNTTYTETNLVPMPKGNLLFGVTYHFK